MGKKRTPTSLVPVNANTAPEYLHFKKAVEAIAIRPKAGRITMLMRKTFNVLLRHAQQEGVDKETYSVRLAELISNVSEDSNDYDTFREYLRRMQATQVEWNTVTEEGSKEWGISSMIAEAVITQDKKHGYVLSYSFGSKIKRRLLDPIVYAQFSLRFQSQLRSNASVVLYEICARYATNPSNLTMRESWAWWRPVLTGTPESDGGSEYAEYKYFKRDVLKPAMLEVNNLTDLDVELVEHKIGRRVDEIQFHVSKKKQKSLELGDGPIVDAQLISRMVALGLSQDEARSAYVDNEEGLIRATVEMTEGRVKKDGLSEVHSASAYFKNALKHRYAEPKLLRDKQGKTKNIATTEDTKKKIRELFLEQRRLDARALFNEMSEKDRQKFIDSFESEILPDNKYLSNEYRKKGLNSKMVEVAFLSWFATKTWGEPSESDLLDFAIKNGVVGKS